MSSISRRGLLAGGTAVGTFAATASFAQPDQIAVTHDMRGKSILITGCSSGFGRLMAEDFARKGAKVGGDTASADRASVKVNLPMKDLISNDDVTASVEYDIPSQNATLNLGYTSGDVRLGVKSNFNVKSNAASHKATVNYSGIEGVGVEVDCNQDVAGNLSVTKDKYELRVPFSKDGGVNPDDVQLRMTWSQSL